MIDTNWIMGIGNLRSRLKLLKDEAYDNQQRSDYEIFNSLYLKAKETEGAGEKLGAIIGQAERIIENNKKGGIGRK